MENCFVFKLNSEINNDNLPLLGKSQGIIKKPASGYGSLTIPSGKKVKITIQSDVDLVWEGTTSKTKTFTGTGSTQYFGLSGNYTDAATCIIENYWNVNNFTANIIGMNIADFTPASTSISITASGTAGLIFGDIADFYKNINMTSINFNGNPNLGGSINELADRMFAAGRTSGSLAIYAARAGMKKNGASFDSATINFTSSGWTFA